MDIKEILKRCDHTLLTQGAVSEDIFALIDDAVKYGTASVCIPPSFVRAAAVYAEGKTKNFADKYLEMLSLTGVKRYDEILKPFE